MSNNSLAENAFFNTLYKALTVIFPVVTVSYSSHILGATGIGAVSSAQNFVTYFIMLASLGIPTYGVRAIAKSRCSNNKQQASTVFSELIVINTVSTFLSFIAYIIWISFLGGAKLNIIFGSLIVLNFFNLEWVYQGFEEYKYIAMRSVLIKLISLGLLFLLVHSYRDLLVYAVIICFGTAGNYILNVTRLHKYVHFQYKGLEIYNHLKPIFILFASVIAIEIYSLLDVTMLTNLTSSEHVGYYSNAVKIVKMIANTFTSIGAVLLPRLSVYYASNNNSKIEKIVTNFFKAILFIALPSCVGVVLIANQIVFVLFGPEFADAIPTLRILSILMIMMPLSGGLFGQLLLTANKETEFFKCVVSGSVGNAILNAILIPIFSQNGAALASVFTETLVTVMMALECRKMTKIRLDIQHVSTIIIATLSMASVMLLCSSLLNGLTYIIKLLINVSLGAIVYAVVLILLKNETALEIIGKMGKKRCFEP